MRVQFRFFGCGHPVLPTLFVEDWWEFLKASKLTSGLHIHLLISNLTVWEYTKIKPGSSQGLLHTKYCPWKSSRDQLEISVLKNKDHRETQGQRVKDKTTQSDEEVTMKIMTSITSGSQINIRQTDNICLYRQSRGATVCLHGVQPAFHKGPCSLEPIFLCFHISSHFHYKRVGTSGKKKRLISLVSDFRFFGKYRCSVPVTESSSICPLCHLQIPCSSALQGVLA